MNYLDKLIDNKLEEKIIPYEGEVRTCACVGADKCGASVCTHVQRYFLRKGAETLIEFLNAHSEKYIKKASEINK